MSDDVPGVYWTWEVLPPQPPPAWDRRTPPPRPPVDLPYGQGTYGDGLFGVGA